MIYISYFQLFLKLFSVFNNPFEQNFSLKGLYVQKKKYVSTY